MNTTERGFDVIGDIHGFAWELELLLGELGYNRDAGVWRHPSRQVVFVGDLIDKGPDQIRVLRLVRDMVDHGSALAVMGNHEFNAVCWATPSSLTDDETLRPHSDKNYRQHKAFLKQVGEGTDQHREWVEWLARLPLFLDLPEFRVVHAYWSDERIGRIAPHLDASNALRPESWQRIAHEQSSVFPDLEAILKGPEIALPEGASFRDNYGQLRTSSRVQWWNTQAQSYRDLAMVPPGQSEGIPQTPAPVSGWTPYADSKPLFIGHYWLRGQPASLSETVACLDYSVALGSEPGKLCAYRWFVGDQRLHNGRFVWVDCQKQ